MTNPFQRMALQGSKAPWVFWVAPFVLVVMALAWRNELWTLWRGLLLAVVAVTAVISIGGGIYYAQHRGEFQASALPHAYWLWVGGITVALIAVFMASVIFFGR
ncbi:MAG TPA: hypothetical protein VMV65_07520 [Alphaproteobacteria bacterium]|nr:hypothetical protein [Alphaproteobacteria bacterium]